MAAPPTSAPGPPPPALTIHEATRIPGGVRRGALLTRAQAEQRRKAGLDIVVCGNNVFANDKEAQQIESAVGACKHCGPHSAGGLQALAHWEQRSKKPAGHSFYETPQRKAIP